MGLMASVGSQFFPGEFLCNFAHLWMRHSLSFFLDPLFGDIYWVNNLGSQSGWLFLGQSPGVLTTHYKSFRFPKLRVPLLQCNSLMCTRAAWPPLCHSVGTGFGETSSKPTLLLLWVMEIFCLWLRSFVSLGSIHETGQLSSSAQSAITKRP